MTHCQLSQCSTARESSAGFSHVCHTMVEALKSFLLSENSLDLKMKNTWLIFVITLAHTYKTTGQGISMYR